MFQSQILIYPVIHPFDFQSPSYQQYHKFFPGCSMLNPRMMAQWYLHYLGIPVTRMNTQKLLHNQHIQRYNTNLVNFKLAIISYLLQKN